jgi:Sec7-like guanine-nucleotide exchange factor
MTRNVGKATLTAMVALFDFRALTVDQALRVCLEAFRLPGEAQHIDRIVQVCSCVLIFCFRLSGLLS